MSDTKTSERPQSGARAHRPAPPVQLSPLFSWPPAPRAIYGWFARYYLHISTTILFLIVAVAAWALLLPTMEAMRTLSAGWVLQIWLKNFCLLTLWAGGLHLYLWRFRRQGRTLKFDHREMATGNKLFTFNAQVLDNMFWSLASGVTFWTIYEALYFWGAANGYAPVITLSDNPVWFVLWFGLIPIWSSFHFYWIHRALHWPPLYRIGHALHHRNINTGPWTGISMHPVEHAIYFTSFLIHFVVASHPAHMMFHTCIQSLGPAASHSGFEGLAKDGEKKVALGDFFHQLHHRYFECNYGTVEMPWDRWFGSFHDGTEGATAAFRDRKRRMHG